MNRENIMANLQKIMILYLAVWTVSPPLSIDMVYRLLAMLCALGWFFIAVMRKIELLRIHAFALLYALMIVAVAYYDYGGFDGILKQIGTFVLVMAYIMLFFYRDRMDELRGLIPALLIILTVWNVISARELIIDPTLARRIVRADAEMEPFLRMGVGGYGLIYTQVCVFPALVMWVWQALKSNRIMFAIGAIWLSSFVTYALSSGYSIALMASLLGTFIMLVYKRRNVTFAIVISAVIIFAFLYALVNWDAFRNALLEYFDGTKVAKKIQDLVSTATTDETADSIASRIIRYRASLDTMYYYPVVGGLIWDGGGGHSAILDTFAKYGLFGGIMFVRMAFCVPFGYKRSVNNKLLIHISNGVLISMFFVLLLDSFPYDMVIMVTIGLASVYADIVKWKELDISSLDIT